MVRLTALAVLAIALVAHPAAAAPAAPTPVAPTPVEIVAAAPSGAWATIAADDLVLLDLPGGPAGAPRRVTIQLAPGFAPEHVANIRRLVAARSFERTSVVRVQDDYVVQWGDATRPPPPGLALHPPAEYERALRGLAITPLAGPDAYAPAVGFALGWPVGYDRAEGKAWLAHCYGMVGVGRDMPPDTGSGAELYAVIGQAPRQLDRNVALVGRVLHGMELLSGSSTASKSSTRFRAARRRSASMRRRPGARRSCACGSPRSCQPPSARPGRSCGPRHLALPPTSRLAPTVATRSICAPPAGWICATCRCRSVASASGLREGAAPAVSVAFRCRPRGPRSSRRRGSPPCSDAPPRSHRAGTPAPPGHAADRRPRRRPGRGAASA